MNTLNKALNNFWNNSTNTKNELKTYANTLNGSNIFFGYYSWNCVPIITMVVLIFRFFAYFLSQATSFCFICLIDGIRWNITELNFFHHNNNLNKFKLETMVCENYVEQILLHLHLLYCENVCCFVRISLKAHKNMENLDDI